MPAVLRSRRSCGPRQIAAALAALVLPLAGCAGLPHLGAAETATPTTIAIPAAPLHWRTVTLPGQVTASTLASFAASPVDGRAAWLCAPQGVGGFDVWATDDAAATWHLASMLTPVTPAPAADCRLLADQGNARTLVAEFDSGSGEAGTLRTVSYVSADGGAHWHSLPDALQVMELASAGATTYAILHATDGAPNQPSSGLVVSGDALRNWRALDPAGLPSGDAIFQFWIEPGASTLLAASYLNTLWLTADAGSTWAPVPTPPTQTSLVAWLAPRRVWELCWHADPQLPQEQCSLDLGQTARPRPLLSFTSSCAACYKGKPYTNTSACDPTTVAPDGALLALCPAGNTTLDFAGAPGPFALYRLTLDSTRWTSLGPVPGQQITVPASGPLWSADVTTRTLAQAPPPWQADPSAASP